ncbi:MAG: hypothetical protein QXX95_07765 [Nitrososphaerales archaeon]
MSKILNFAIVFLIIQASMGILILTTDKLLWEIAATSKAYPLIGFIIVDFILAGWLVVRKIFSWIPIFSWALIRLLLQFGDLLTAPMVYNEPMEISLPLFANYLFNPLDTQGVKFGNPFGIPAIAIDVMVLMYILLIILSLRGRK